MPAIVVGDPVYLVTPQRARVLAIFAAAEGETLGAALIVHGLGVHPDWGLINGLRSDLPDAGIATLAVQMPVLAADAPRSDYAALYPEAEQRIAAGIDFLKRRGIARIAIIGHSFGASMVDAWLATPSAARIATWVPIGMQGSFAVLPTEPVLDVVAQNDLPEVLATAAARAATLPRDGCSRQVTISGAEHFMASRRRELAEVVAGFIKIAFSGRCR